MMFRTTRLGLFLGSLAHAIDCQKNPELTVMWERVNDTVKHTAFDLYMDSVESFYQQSKSPAYLALKKAKPGDYYPTLALALTDHLLTMEIMIENERTARAILAQA